MLSLRHAFVLLRFERGVVAATHGDSNTRRQHMATATEGAACGNIIGCKTDRVAGNTVRMLTRMRGICTLPEEGLPGAIDMVALFLISVGV